MKRLLLMAAAASLIAAPAFATVSTVTGNTGAPTIASTGGTTGSNSPNVTTATSSHSEQTQGQGQTQGQTATGGTGLGVGIAGALSGSSSVSGPSTSSAVTGASTSSATNDSHNTAQGGAAAGGNASGQTTSLSVDASNHYRRNVASAISPTLVLPSCSVGATGAAQGATFGISLGGAKESKWCEVNARTALIGTLGIDGSHKADCYLAAKDPDYAGQLAALEGADYCTVRIVDAPAPVSAVSAPPSAAVVETPEERGERG